MVLLEHGRAQRGHLEKGPSLAAAKIALITNTAFILRQVTKE